jgi:uncharacterized protein
MPKWGPAPFFRDRRVRSRKWRILFFSLASILLFSSVLCMYAFWVEPKRLVIKEATVEVEKWPRQFDSIRIAALADIHVGSPYITLQRLEEIVQRTNDAKPDMVVLLGDYVILGVLGGDFVPPEPIAFVLQKLKAPLGVYAVMGNHDWWYDGYRTIRAFEKAGIRVLENDALPIHRDGDTLWVVGFADTWTRRTDVETAVRKVPPHAVAVGLTHNPDVFPKVPPNVVLTLAGHTHGGQVYVPLIGRPVVPSRFGQAFAIGDIKRNHQHLFVTPGIGTSVIPVRLATPPEISVVKVKLAAELVRPQARD